MIRIEVQSDARNLREIAREMNRGSVDVLTAVGTELLGFVAEDFEAKARGQVGAGGIKWEPLSEARVKQKAKRAKGGDTSTLIGVDLGMLRNAVQPGFKPPDGQGGNVFEANGSEVEVGYGRKYAEHFDKKRPLIPDAPPEEWITASEEIIADWIDDLWNKRVKN